MIPSSQQIEQRLKEWQEEQGEEAIRIRALRENLRFLNSDKVAKEKEIASLKTRPLTVRDYLEGSSINTVI